MGMIQQIPQFAPLQIPGMYHKPSQPGQGGGLFDQLLGGGGRSSIPGIGGMPGQVSGGGPAMLSAGSLGGGAADVAGKAVAGKAAAGAAGGIGSIMPELLQLLAFM